MKRVLLFLLSVVVASALSVFDVSVKIYGTLLRDLFSQKKVLLIYSDDEKIKIVLDHLSYVMVVDTPKRADILILSKKDDVKRWSLQKPTLVTSYYLLRNYPEVLGGFFWQKGRPNIVLLRSSLQRFHIYPPASLRAYVEDSP